MNPIRSLIYSRITALLAESNGLESVPHDLTRGELREQLLLDFFTDILPDRYTVCSGFITDIHGTVTPQTDFIVAETADVPRLILNGEVSLIPVEAARAVAEIKTTIRSNDLAQLEKRMEVQKKLQVTYLSVEPINNIVVPTYIIAFNSKVSLKKIEKYLEDHREVAGCCIVGQYSFVRHDFFNENDDWVKLEDNPSEESYEATSTFIGCFFRHLTKLSQMNTPNHQLAVLLSKIPHPVAQEVVQRLRGALSFWEAYVSEELLKAANQRRVDSEDDQ